MAQFDCREKKSYCLNSDVSAYLLSYFGNSHLEENSSHDGVGLDESSDSLSEFEHGR